MYKKICIQQQLRMNWAVRIVCGSSTKRRIICIQQKPYIEKARI